MLRRKDIVFPALVAYISNYGYKHKDVAEEAGIKPKSFSRCINGQQLWSFGDCYSILNVLGIPHDQFTTFFPESSFKKALEIIEKERET